MHTARARSNKRAQISLDRPNVTACIRCRQRKKKCDQKLPRCTLCANAQVECVVHDAATKRTVPRSYVHNLEERVAFLELKLQGHGIHDYDESPPVSSSHEVVALPEPHSLVVETEKTQNSPCIDPATSEAAQKTIDEVLNLVKTSTRQEPVFSKLLLTELMRPETISGAARAWSLPISSATNRLTDMVNDLDTSLAPLPDKKGAQYLTKVYFEFISDAYPLMHEPTFRHKLDELYKMPDSANIASIYTSQESGLSVFFAFMVFAISLLVLQNHKVPGVPTSLCDRYHKTALRALKEAGLPVNVEGVQALLLSTQYSYFHSDIHEAWKSIGMALRLSVELGLHQDPPAGKQPFLTLDTMRRTFWVAYAMDRTIGITLGWPSCLSDGSITAQFPSDVDDEYITSDGIKDPGTAPRGLKRYSIHLLRYRQFQSEMQTILYEKTYPNLLPINYKQWQESMYGRIKAWYDCLPEDHLPENLELNTVTRPDMWELAFHRALLFLYRPSPRVPSLSSSAFMALAESSRRLIYLYRRIFLENRVTILWQAVENLFSAGTALLFSYINSTQVQQSINLRSMEADIYTCSSLLWGMVESIPAFKAKRDAFDIIATKTLADLDSNPVIRDGLTESDFSTGNFEGASFGEVLNGYENGFSSASFAAHTSSLNEGERQPPTTARRACGTATQTVQSQSNEGSSNSHTSQVDINCGTSTFDHDEMAIDWEAFETANELRPSTQFLPSAWL